jgi:hypothetical protein
VMVEGEAQDGELRTGTYRDQRFSSTNSRLTSLNRPFPTGSQHNAETTPRRRARKLLNGPWFQTSGHNPFLD